MFPIGGVDRFTLTQTAPMWLDYNKFEWYILNLYCVISWNDFNQSNIILLNKTHIFNWEQEIQTVPFVTIRTRKFFLSARIYQKCACVRRCISGAVSSSRRVTWENIADTLFLRKSQVNNNIKSANNNNWFSTARVSTKVVNSFDRALSWLQPPKKIQRSTHTHRSLLVRRSKAPNIELLSRQHNSPLIHFIRKNSR